MERIWKTGEKLRITVDGRTVDAHVILASTNGLSLMLGFNAMLRGYVGSMPILYEEKDQKFYDLIRSQLVELEPVPA